ncbi:alpha-1,4-N-acetylglucosaminyltransferase-like [Pseudophryne corroboree]|uniref:alpha-1,4-N-acetylglucosaminyltransferase-like n=1 Tax=Pseudophryne corroboree TaxID=495146 RepID=UPI003081543D
MLKVLRILVFMLFLVVLASFYGITYRQSIISHMSLFPAGYIFNAFNPKPFTTQANGTIYVLSTKPSLSSSETFTENIARTEKTSLGTNNTSSVTSGSISSTPINPSDILEGGDSIIFLETSDRMQLPSLVLCAIESAAHVYKDRPVVYFMKGLNDTNSKVTAMEYFPMLSSFNNVYFFPLRMDNIFKDTPLLSWYQKVNQDKEPHWVHISADGCRLALLWKHGGIYMDTDMISIRTIPHQNFLAAQASKFSSNGVFGFSSHHNFTWQSMNNFVKHYNAKIWGHQGPHLFTRVLKELCDLPQFQGLEDITCRNITFLNPQRFYPISYPSWKKYYQVWNSLPTFNDSYALHLWNYMNRNIKVNMVPGSNTLVEQLYKQHCPSTYAAIITNQTAPF